MYPLIGRLLHSNSERRSQARSRKPKQQVGDSRDSTVDANRVIVTGENSAIRLSPTDGDSFTTNASFWRILSSAAGAGHVLYLKSELTEGLWRIYSEILQ